MPTLQSARYLSLATFRRNGAEVRTPVWFAATSDSTFYCFSAGSAGKVKRIRRSSQAQLAKCDAFGGNIGEWSSCQAFLVTNPDENKLAYEALRRKYGIQMFFTDLLATLSGRIRHRVVIRLSLDMADAA